MDREQQRLLRLDTIFKSLNEGLPTLLIDKKLRLLDDSFGAATARRGKAIITDLPEVLCLERPQDTETGFREWVRIDGNITHRLPIKFKSSEAGVRKFKQSDTFRRIGGEIIVVNSGPQVNTQGVKKNFRREVHRVHSLIERHSQIDNEA